MARDYFKFARSNFRRGCVSNPLRIGNPSLANIEKSIGIKGIINEIVLSCYSKGPATPKNYKTEITCILKLSQ